MAIDFRDGEILTATQLNDLQAEYAPALQRIAAQAQQTGEQPVATGAQQLLLNEVTGTGASAASGGVRIDEPGVYIVTTYLDIRHGTNDAGVRRDCYLSIDSVAGEIARTISTYPQQNDNNQRILNQINTVLEIAGGEVVRFMTISSTSASANALYARLNIVRVAL